MTRTLLTGWFSVEGGEATAGDLLAMEEVRSLLQGEGQRVDVATNAGFPDGVDWRTVSPDRYERLVFVCGPLHGERVRALVDRFPAATKLAVNVSVVDDELADRFDVVLPRERDDEVHPDLTVDAEVPEVPVIGVVRSHPQPEYDAAHHRAAHDTIRLVLASRPCATVDFDTRVHPAADPLAAHARDAAEVVAVAGRMDAIVTTRLHGLVLGLLAGTPVLAVDPVAGGAKVARQAAVLDWPCVLTADGLSPEHLAEALEWCLGEEARAAARRSLGAATDRLDRLRGRLRRALAERP